MYNRMSEVSKYFVELGAAVVVAAITFYLLS